MGLRLNLGSQYWHLYDFLKVHISQSVNLNLKVMHLLVLSCFFNQALWLLCYFPLFRYFLISLDWHSNFLSYQKLCLFLFSFSGKGDGGWMFWARLILVGDFIIDHLNRFFEDECQFQYSWIILVYLVKLQNERFSHLIDSQVIPLAPCTIIS